MAHNINLDDLSLEELKSLQRQVAKAIDSFEDRQKRDALAALEKTAKEHGFNLGDLLGGAAPKVKGTRAKAEAKYAHPDNPSLTWSGRGRKPQWFADALASGKSPEDLAAR